MIDLFLCVWGGDFTYDNSKIEKLEREYLRRSGFSIGIARHLSKDHQNDLIVELVGNEAIKTSEIKGEFFDRESKSPF